MVSLLLAGLLGQVTGEGAEQIFVGHTHGGHSARLSDGVSQS